MKTLIIFFVSFCTCTAAALGQNSVTVKQQGSGNSVSISQSSSHPSDKDCSLLNTAAQAPTADNSILVVKGSAAQDTVANQTVSQYNTVINHPLLPWLFAIQQGKQNSLFIFNSNSTTDVNSQQTGTQNSITAWLQSTPTQQITLSQNGSNNSIAINSPCSKEKK